jgi:glycosyltransferase involved in cell wall biosynthesis
MKLSVALCTFNGEKFIEQQINSILNQSIKVDEIVVCDDQSTDKTVEILKKLQSENSAIVIVENEINLRSTKNFEKAISLCTGDFIFLSDQDDVWYVQKVKKTLAVFKENPLAEGVFSNANLIDENNAVFTNKTIWDSVFFLEKELKKPLNFFDIIAKNGNVVTGATLCIKKEVKSFIVPFSEENLHDEWIATLLALRETLFYSKENLISYRIHNSQQVGMKNLDKIEKKTHKKRIILGLEQPKKFSDYRYLLKKMFLKEKGLINLRKYNFDFLNLSNLIIESGKELDELRSAMKIFFPLQYQMTSLIDTILGKRKL